MALSFVVKSDVNAQGATVVSTLQPGGRRKEGEKSIPISLKRLPRSFCTPEVIFQVFTTWISINQNGCPLSTTGTWVPVLVGCPDHIFPRTNLIGHSSVAWPHLASRNTGKCSLYSRRPWAHLATIKEGEDLYSGTASISATLWKVLKALSTGPQTLATIWKTIFLKTSIFQKSLDGKTWPEVCVYPSCEYSYICCRNITFDHEVLPWIPLGYLYVCVRYTRKYSISCKIF